MVTDTFEALARATAKGMGMPDLPLHIIPESIETLSPEALEQVGERLFEALDYQVASHAN